MPVSFGARLLRQQAEQAERRAAEEAGEHDEALRVDVAAAQEAPAGPQAPAPPPAAAPAPAPGRPVALVVDPKNPRTPKEDSDRIYQWIGRPREFSFEEMTHWTKAGFSFTTKCQGGWYWFRKPWHAVDARIDSRNPRSISEDHNRIYQWNCNVANQDDGWNYCGQDREGQRWYRRPWPEPDPNNPRRPQDDTRLKFCWAVLASGGDNMEMIRDDWEYVGKGPQNGTNLWRKPRRVAGVLPPDAADPEARHEVEAARRAADRRVRQRVAFADARRAARDAQVPSDDDDE